MLLLSLIQPPKTGERSPGPRPPRWLRWWRALDRFLHSSLWPLPTLADYETLAAESEYAAWTIHNRYYLNHFTISVHDLPAGYNTLAAFNSFLERRGFLLNDAGRLIKQSPDSLLLQSATVARMIPASFAGGETKPIAGSYVEFAERKILPAYASLPAASIRRGSNDFLHK